jgi:hypothetical protein
MLRTRRQPGNRRWGLDNEFPLRDSGGFVVLADRRRTPDRRREDATMEELATLLSKARQEND